MPVEKNGSDKYLLKSLFSFFWAFAMVLVMVIPLLVNPYVATFYSVRYFWLYLLVFSIPIFLFFYFLGFMNVYFKKGKDDYIKTPRWGLLLTISVILSIATAVLAIIFWTYVVVLAFAIPTIELLILFINAAVICKNGYSKSYH